VSEGTDFWLKLGDLKVSKKCWLFSFSVKNHKGPKESEEGKMADVNARIEKPEVFAA